MRGGSPVAASRSMDHQLSRLQAEARAGPQSQPQPPQPVGQFIAERRRQLGAARCKLGAPDCEVHGAALPAQRSSPARAQPPAGAPPPYLGLSSSMHSLASEPSSQHSAAENGLFLNVLPAEGRNPASDAAAAGGKPPCAAMPAAAPPGPVACTAPGQQGQDPSSNGTDLEGFGLAAAERVLEGHAKLRSCLRVRVGRLKELGRLMGGCAGPRCDVRGIANSLWLYAGAACSRAHAAALSSLVQLSCQKAATLPSCADSPSVLFVPL